MVNLWSVGRLYGSFTAHWKAIQFICGPLEGRTAHFTDHKQDSQPAWSTTQKAAQKVPQEGFPTHFLYVLWFYFYVFLLCFIVLLKQITEAIHKQFYFKYCQCIIIAPVIQKNFLYISFVFYSFISYVFLLYFTVLLK